MYSGKFSSLASIIDSLITNAERSIDVPLVKPNCNDDCCDGSRCSIEVTAAITKLNNKKSGDEFGISAEHFKLAGQSIVAALVELFNAILEHGYIPPQFLSGVITPVYKKGRDATVFIDGLQHRRLFVNREKLYIVVNTVLWLLL
jgi:hypothetical protein